MTTPGRSGAAIVASCGTLVLAVLLLDGAVTSHGAWRWIAAMGSAAALVAAMGEVSAGIAALGRRG